MVVGKMAVMTVAAIYVSPGGLSAPFFLRSGGRKVFLFKPGDFYGTELCESLYSKL